MEDLTKIKRKIYCETCSDILQTPIYHTNYCEKTGKVLSITRNDCYRKHIKPELDYYGAERLIIWAIRGLASDLERIRPDEVEKIDSISLKLKRLISRERKGMLSDSEKDNSINLINELKQEKMYYQDRIAVNIIALRDMLKWTKSSPEIILLYCQAKESHEGEFKKALIKKIESKLLFLESSKG